MHSFLSTLLNLCSQLSLFKNFYFENYPPSWYLSWNIFTKINIMKHFVNGSLLNYKHWNIFAYDLWFNFTTGREKTRRWCDTQHPVTWVTITVKCAGPGARIWIISFLFVGHSYTFNSSNCSSVPFSIFKWSCWNIPNWEFVIPTRRLPPNSSGFRPKPVQLG